MKTILIFFTLLMYNHTLFAQPANDDCENAIPVELGEMISASILGATPENVAYAGVDCSSPSPNSAADVGVWYSFVAPASPVNIILNGDFDTEVAVHFGACDMLNCIASDDDGGPGVNSLITNLQLIEGQTYLVFVEGFAGNTGMFMVEACVNELTCNDLTVYLDDTGVETISPLDLAMATCDMTGIVASQTAFDCADVAASPITVTVSQGNVSCMSIITVTGVTGLPCGWTAETNGVGCNTGNNFTYNFTSKVFTATSTNCYYPNSFTSDALAFAQYDLCGNGSITAQVTSISGGLGWAGVTMRESNASGAKKAQLMTNLSTQSRREFRTTTNGQAYPQQFPSQNSYWLRITRTGNQFAMYISQNGTSWSLNGVQTIVMGNCIEVGLVMTNYTANSTVTASFANVSVTGGNITKPTINTQEDILTAADFSILPNPTTGIISLDLNSYGKREVRLDMYNLQGKLLRSTNMETGRGKEEIDLTAFASGMYLIRVRAEGLPDVTKRVVLNSNQ